MLFTDPIDLKMPDAEVQYYPNFFNTSQADQYFQSLLSSIQWQQDSIKVYGKSHLQPRLTAFYANNSNAYSYSNIKMTPHPFNSDLQKIKHRIEMNTQVNFTSCLANLYRNGKDSNGWHADDEKELGENPIIASVSFGEARRFKFKHKFKPDQKVTLNLEHGSLLLMKGSTQKNWLHQIPKTQVQIGRRINLTFRIIV